MIDENAVLGPIDPQLGQSPAASVLRVLHQKEPQHIDDATLILADQAEKALKQTRTAIEELLCDRLDLPRARQVAETLSEGNWTHDHAITPPEIAALGLNVTTEFPTAVYGLMDLYAQPVRRSPTVEYSPEPIRAPRAKIG